MALQTSHATENQPLPPIVRLPPGRVAEPASAAVDRFTVLTMPFPLAHPAVVLPLWRIRRLSLSALMLGCLTPDFSYALPGVGWISLAHSLPGTFWFCLPLGLFAYGIFRAIREPLANWLPAPHRAVLLTLCRGRRHSWFAIALSVWIAFLVVPLLIIAFGTDNPVRHWPWRYRVQHFVHDTLARYLVVLSGLILLLGLLSRLRQPVLPRPAPPE